MTTVAPKRVRQHPIAWEPSEKYVEDANVTRLMGAHGIADVEELRGRALDAEWFWNSVIRDLGIEFETPHERVLDLPRGPEWPEWFIGGQLNLAASCLDGWSERRPDQTAVVWEGERGETRHVTFAELRELADGVGEALRSLGVRPEDTVAIFMPLAPEAVAALYGCWKLGAIAVPIFSGFGPEAVAARLRDADASVLVTADGFPRRGSVVPMKEIADEALAAAPNVEHVLVWRRLGLTGRSWDAGRDSDWDELVRRGSRLEAMPVASGHPALLMYTSGSTGRPKGALLSHAGLLTNVAKDAAYHLDLNRDDTLCWVTDLGWIMGPWEIVAAGVIGATVCLVEGSPTTPSPDRLWRLVGRERITVLGVGPSLVRGLASLGATPGRDLRSLRILGGTGEPWSPEAYTWLLAEVGGKRCPIINFSGGTEVGGCFLAPLPIQPLKICSLGGPALGMDMAVVGESGCPLGPGQVGELVCRAPWPGMTRGLWRDPERYVDTYWRRFPGMWVHGDWASFDADGQWFLHGRSDDTLNIAGQRLGPAEAEGVLADQPGVAEAAAVAVPHAVKGEAMWCFVVPAGKEQPDANRLADSVAERLGKPFKPERIFFVTDLPRTRSGKILRRVIRAAALGTDPGDLCNLEDDSAISAIRSALE